MKEKRKCTLITGNGPFIARKINRNQLCPCGSGKKFKNCHNIETQYYVKKPKNIVNDLHPQGIQQ